MRTRNDNQTALSSYGKDLGRYPPLERHEERRLILAYAKGDRSAGDRIVRAHLRYVVDTAKRYVGHGVAFEDLIQEGNLGLLQALERFDRKRRSRRSRRSVRFLAYASHWVKAKMTLAIQEKGKTIKVNRTVQLAIARMRKLDRLTESDIGRSATVPEVAKQLRLKEDYVRQLRVAEALRFVSFDQPVRQSQDERNEMTFHEVVATEHVAADDVYADRSFSESRHRAFAEAIETLIPVEQIVLRDRLLRDEDERKTHARLGREMGLSRSRIQQIEHKLKQKLKALMHDDECRKRRLKDD